MLWIVGLVTAGLTAFYMWRLMNMTFYGKSRVKPEVAAHIHESPPSMTVPLMVLAAGGVLAGWVGVPKAVEPAGELPGVRTLAGAGVRLGGHRGGEAGGAHDASTEWILMAISVAVAIIGIVVARYFYHHKPHIPDNPRTGV